MAAGRREELDVFTRCRKACLSPTLTLRHLSVEEDDVHINFSRQYDGDVRGQRYKCGQQPPFVLDAAPSCLPSF
jgi:hypothetical protein